MPTDPIADALIDGIHFLENKLGMGTDYPHRPIPAIAQQEFVNKLFARIGIAIAANVLALTSATEALLSSSVMGLRLAPHLTWHIGAEETPTTLVGPHKAHDQPPSFVTGLSPTNPTPWLTVSSAAQTDALNASPPTPNMAGSAVDATRHFIQEQKTLPNLCLDADRGYLYHAWKPKSSGSGNPLHQMPVSAQYLP